MIEKDLKKLTGAELGEMARKSEDLDRAIFAEMRNNAQLVDGNHYDRNRNFYDYGRRPGDAYRYESGKRLRIVKNYIGTIHDEKHNALITDCPEPVILPVSEDEIQDRKCAEIARSVWDDIKRKNNWDCLKDLLASHFLTFGECACYIRFNELQGKFLGYEAAQNETGEYEQMSDPYGEPVMDEMGNEAYEEDENKAMFEGGIEIEYIVPFNILRAPGILDLSKSPYYGIKDPITLEELKKRFDLERQEIDQISQNMGGTNVYLYDSNTNAVEEKENMAILNTWLFKPTRECPYGYFYVECGQKILQQGDIPYGVFPLIIATQAESSASPRGKSFIRQIRPEQINLNRLASKRAEHSTTIGDDKLVITDGGEVDKEFNYPGIRTLSLSGGDIKHLPGRDGSQFNESIQMDKKDMYEKSRTIGDYDMKDDHGAGKSSSNLYSLLFRSLSQKRKNSNLIKRFERFLTEVCTVSVRTAQVFYDEYNLIKTAGKQEFVNIAEFRNLEEQSYDIKVEAVTEDLNSVFGRQLTLQHLLQYAGKNLEPGQIAKIYRDMPFAGKEDIFKDLLIDVKNGDNMILALDRGDQFQPDPLDNPEYMSKRIIERMRESDFKHLQPQLQQQYNMTLESYKMLHQQKLEMMKQVNAGMIPATGPLVRAEVWVETIGARGQPKTAKMEIPSHALEWLYQRLQEQQAITPGLQTLTDVEVKKLNQEGAQQKGQVKSRVVGTVRKN